MTVTEQAKKCPHPEKRAYTQAEMPLAKKHLKEVRQKMSPQARGDLVIYKCRCGMHHIGHDKVRLAKRARWVLNGSAHGRKNHTSSWSRRGKRR
jgi:hypothetical protein